MEMDLEKVLLHCEEVMSSKGYAVIVARDPQWANSRELYDLGLVNTVGILSANWLGWLRLEKYIGREIDG